jgi:hypothetical protein
LLKSLGAKKSIPAVGAAINLKNIWIIWLLLVCQVKDD